MKSFAGCRMQEVESLRKLWCLGGLASLLLISSRPTLASCRLPAASEDQIPLGSTCFEGLLSAGVLGISDKLDRRLGTQALLQSYLGVYASDWLSLHSKSYMKYAYQSHSARETSQQRTTEQFFLQLGQPLDQRVHAALGLLPMPFGVNRDLYRSYLRSRGHKFWSPSLTGLRLSLRVRDDLRLELGGGSQSPDDVREAGSKTLAVRLTKLTDLLSGTKLTASYQADSFANTRRLGLASLIYNNNNFTSLEWVRINEDNSDKFAQLFRFAHEQKLDPWAWNFLYEDIRDDSYRVSLGFARRFLEDWSLSSSFHYEKLRGEDDQHQGYLLLNLAYGISETFRLGAEDFATN